MQHKQSNSLVYVTGGPSAANKEDLYKSTSAAKRLADNMKARHPGNFGSKGETDSDGQPGGTRVR